MGLVSIAAVSQLKINEFFLSHLFLFKNKMEITILMLNEIMYKTFILIFNFEVFLIKA